MKQIISGQFGAHEPAMACVWALNRAGLPLRDIPSVSLSMQPRGPLNYRGGASALSTATFSTSEWWGHFFEAVLGSRMDREHL